MRLTIGLRNIERGLEYLSLFKRRHVRRQSGMLDETDGITKQRDGVSDRRDRGVTIYKVNT